MRFTVKFLAFLLAVASLSASFAGCDKGSEATGNGSEAQTTISEATTDAEVTPDFPKRNYDETMFLQVSGGIDYFWVEEGEGDVISEALYDRQEKIMDYLGVEIVATVAEGDHLTNYQEFMNCVKNKDGAIDMYFTNSYTGIPQMITSGYLRDLATVDALDLEADYWNMPFMDSLSLFDRYYLGYNDFCVPKSYMITFNKTMMKQYGDSLGTTVYEMVNNYEWTLDRMIALAKLVYVDKSSDGKTEDDTFGITGQQWIPFIAFLQASNVQLVEQDESGEYKVSVYNEKNKEKTTVLVEKLGDLAKNNCAWFKFRIEPTTMIPLTTNRTLMYLAKSTELEGFLDYEVEFGVLPYPMFDEAQKDIGYRSWNFDGNITLPSYLDNEQMVAETMELLAFYGTPVQIAVFEKMLGKQVADTPDDVAMLNIIWDNLCSDFGSTYSHITGALDNNMYMLPWLTNPNGTDSLASYVASYENSANKSLKKFISQVKKKG